MRRLNSKDWQNSSKKEKGQISIFMGIAISCIIACLAFTINVGLFVNAKINLQNAMDAASYAGAAVQARQLTQMGYVNWELRNNFKEFLFKYWVIGNLANTRVSNPPGDGPSGANMRFRARPFSTSSGGVADVEDAINRYNVPAVCINFGSGNNICDIAEIPGLPRFETVGLPAISEHHENFLNEVAETKADDCSRRTDLNFGTSMIWAYGAGGEESGIQADAPQIAAERPGVWPRAIELGLRMRNLEFIANRPPVQGICAGSGTGCSESIGGLMGELSEQPHNERVIKAFMSAYRNLSGGYDTKTGFRDLKNTLNFSEMAPRSKTVDPESELSGFLIRDTVRAGESSLVKYYVDLQAVPINYAIFFRSFVSSSEQTEVTLEGACAGAPTGIPIPLLLTGFVKNPTFLTYYAVKASAKYIGLFYPFKGQGITMNAYSAAKPAGGRIGPRLFMFDGDKIEARTGKPRSAAFIAGLDLSSFPSGVDYKKGYPIPVKNFFLENTGDAIGGVPGSVTPKFSIPNMVYDYVGDMAKHGGIADKFQVIADAPSSWNNTNESGQTTGESFGLYDDTQFMTLLSYLGTPPIGDVSGTKLREAIIKTRRPTMWDAMNYMIPTYYDNESTEFEGVSQVFGEEKSVGSVSYVVWPLYAPLMGPGLLYQAPSEVKEVLNNYLSNAQTGVDLFLKGLVDVAEFMRGQTTTAGSGYGAAADSIAPPGSHGSTGLAATLSDDSFLSDCDKASVAAKFAYFFRLGASGEKCGIKPIEQNLTENYLDKFTADENLQKFFISEYPIELSETPDIEDLHSGYMPGPRQGAKEDGKMTHPFNNGDEGWAKRNYYSVKHIPMYSVTKRTGNSNDGIAPYYADGQTFPYKESTEFNDQERDETTLGTDTRNWHNTLNLSTVDLDEFGPNSSLKF